jgi:G3E family GTPase
VNVLPVQQLDDRQEPNVVGNEALRQVALADVLLLNKIDLVTDECLCAISTRIR